MNEETNNPTEEVNSGFSDEDWSLWEIALMEMEEIDLRADGGRKYFEDRALSFDQIDRTIRECVRRHPIMSVCFKGFRYGFVPEPRFFKGRDPRTGAINLESAQDISLIAAEFAVRFYQNDYRFFEEIARVLAIRGGKRSKKRGRPMSARLIDAADKLSYQLGRNPTREELKTEAERIGIEVADWTKTLKECKLGFLKGRRGRPPKKAE